MTKAILVLACASVLACACAAPNKEPPPKPFAATKWQLVSDVPAAGEAPYVRFVDGRMEGFGGCSRFSARYREDSVGSRFIAIGRIEIDRRLCDPAAQAAETRMVDTLQSVSSYSITADAMSMSGSGGTLRFVASTGALAGTRWKGIVGAGVEEAATPYLEFAEGRLAGFTGCNMLSGAWRMENNEVRVGPLVTTKRGCPGAGGEMEKRVLAVLTERTRFARVGSRLVATLGDERMEFEEIK
jgi:heat shock protein HslJ